MLLFGIGIAARNNSGDLLDTLYPLPLTFDASLESDVATLATKHFKLTPELSYREITLAQADAFAEALQQSHSGEANAVSAAAEALRESAPTNSIVVATLVDASKAVASTPDAYLRLQVLSHRLSKPHTISLESVFGQLPNVAWTSEGPIDLRELPARRLAARSKGQWLSVKSVDKFPPMTDYVVPAGVRIADTARVRLGAYIGEGTTIMHEGFVNFNAGTEGTSMIEGRISAGVMVGEGSDLGGGCSTMGTLSGGGKMIISVGKQCLIGANAGIGIPLGDRCIVEAGLYLTAGAKVTLIDNEGQALKAVKARELAGESDLQFRRNSLNGRIEAVSNRTVVELNSMLHKND
ncbi:DapH/DapD/GlmU-related protein [Allohahella sp. A8]|uniref:DapH/DapD/GlmU-related protein n=1 Tax=Allohahella sp. A8 TaxID=3141461 RepID=UPI003A7FA320